MQTDRITLESPPFAFRADVDTTGECFIPDVFGDNFRLLAAALDWARCFESGGKRASVAPELRAAATAAKALAAQCERLADQADRRG